MNMLSELMINTNGRIWSGIVLPHPHQDTNWETIWKEWCSSLQ